MSENSISIFNKTVFDLDEFSALGSCYWRSNLCQLQPGSFSGSLNIIKLPQYEYSFGNFNVTVFRSSRYVLNDLAICFPLSNPKNYNMPYSPSKGPTICVVPSGKKITGIIPSNLTTAGLHSSIKHLQKHVNHDLSFIIKNPDPYGTFYSVKNAKQFSSLQKKMEKIQELCKCHSNYIMQQPQEIISFSENEILPLLGDILDKAIVSETQQEPTTLQKAMNYIINNSDHPIRIDKLSETLDMSPRNLQYLFNENIGLSPKQFIQLLRLNEARKKLRNTYYSRGKVSDIANELGYWHMGKFTQDFKKLFEIGPLELLRKDPIQTTENIPQPDQFLQLEDFDINTVD